MDIRLSLRLALSMVVGTSIAWLTAASIGLSADSVLAVVILRTLFCVVILILLTRFWVRRAPAFTPLFGSVLVGASISYAIIPTTWVGRTLIGQAVIDPGPATVVIDLVLWAGVAVLASRGVPTRPAQARYEGYAGPGVVAESGDRGTRGPSMGDSLPPAPNGPST